MTPPPNSKTAQNYDLQWGTNVVGHFLLQKLLLPLLVESAKINEEARIIWTSSDGHTWSPSPDGIFWDDNNGDKGKLTTWETYTQSKAGNVILASETARRYAADSIITASLNPGHLKTESQRHSQGCVTDMVNAALFYDARFGAIPELSAGFSTSLSKENNGLYFIPWGRVGTMAKQVKKGLDGGICSKRNCAVRVRHDCGASWFRKWFVMLGLIAMVLVFGFLAGSVLTFPGLLDILLIEVSFRCNYFDFRCDRQHDCPKTSKILRRQGFLKTFVQ